MTRRIGGIVFGIILVASLLSGSVVHALVPHEHGEDHDHHSESIVWQSLHASLRHEDKKALPFFDSFATVGTVFLATIISVRMFSYTVAIADEIRKGIVPYRRFG